MRKVLFGLLTVLLTMVMLAPAALAVDIRDGSRLTVGAGETINDDIVFTGVSVVIDGTVKGDVFAFADTVTVNGTIEGNLIVGASSLDLRGRVTGSVFGGAKDLLVTGTVDGSLVTAGNIQTVDQSATIGRSWIGVGERLRTEGRTGRGLLLAGSEVAVNGSVAGDVKAYVGELILGSNAQVAGPVEYHSERQATVASGARTGELIYRPGEYDAKFDWDHGRNKFWGFGLAISFGGFLAVGLILLSLFPQLRLSFQQAVVEKPLQAPLVGLMILLVTPIAALLLLITLVGIPLSFLSMLLYPLAIYLGQVMLSWTAGRLIADRWEWLGQQNWVLIFLVGALATTLLVRIPGFGFAFGFLAVIYGLGGLYYAFVQSRNGGGPTQMTV